MEAVGELLRAGADVGPATQNGWTALHVAAWNGHADVLAALVRAGGDVNAASSAGRTPHEIAEEGGHGDEVAELRRAGAKPRGGGEG